MRSCVEASTLLCGRRELFAAIFLKAFPFSLPALCIGARGSADLQSISTDQLSLGTATPHVQQKFQEHTQHNFSAAHSNEANAEYVEDFRVGMADMYLALEVPRSTIITKPTAGAIKIGRHGHDHLARYQSCQPSTTQPLAEQRRSLVRGRSGGASLVPDPPHRRIGPNERVGARVESGIPRGSSDVGLASSGGSAGKILLGAERVAKDVRHPSSVRCFGLAAEGWYKGPLDPAGKASEHTLNFARSVRQSVGRDGYAGFCQSMLRPAPRHMHVEECLIVVEVSHQHKIQATVAW